MADYPDPVIIPTIDSFKGHPVLKLPLGEGKNGTRYDFSIGLKKCQAIIEHIEDIRGFVEKVESNPRDQTL